MICDMGYSSLWQPCYCPRTSDRIRLSSSATKESEVNRQKTGRTLSKYFYI